MQSGELNLVDKEYLNLLSDILENGVEKKDRTGVGTKSVFGRMLEFDLSKGFPLLTTKKVYFKGVVHELLWFLKGSTNIKYLLENKVNIWNGNAYDYFIKKIRQDVNFNENKITSMEDFLQFTLEGRKIDIDGETYTFGDLGDVYGQQWRNWQGYDLDGSPIFYDQIKRVINTLKNNPDSRRHIVSAWNVGALENMALPPCHVMFQFYSEPYIEEQDRLVQGYIEPKRRLNLLFTMRSNDFFLGAPFNIASYGLLLSMIAQVTNHSVGILKMSIGDCHLYTNHIKQAKQQLDVAMFGEKLDAPKLWLNPEITNVDLFTYDDIKILDYKSHPTIKAPMAV